MLSNKLVTALLKASPANRKDNIIIELLNHINLDYDYEDAKATHILEMLVDDNAIIKETDIKMHYIESNLNLLVYEPDKYNIKNIRIESIDNIDCIIRIKYDYIEKVNEDRGDSFYITTTTTLSYIDNPKLIKYC